MKKTALIAALLATTATTSVAQDFYGTAFLGYNNQITDINPYGTNIAVDSDFPFNWDAGEGATAGFGIGYQLNSNVRIEGRLSHRTSKASENLLGTGARVGEDYTMVTELNSTALTVEGFYDFDTQSAFTPYLKAGVGVAKNKFAAKMGGTTGAFFDPFDGTTDGFYDAYPTETETSFTWNIGFGASYALNDTTTLFGEYQYVSLGDAATGQDFATDGFLIDGATAHEVNFGVRVAF